MVTTDPPEKKVEKACTAEQTEKTDHFYPEKSGAR